MAIDFPNTPSVNDTFLVGSTTYVWNGTIWNAFVTPVVGPTGPTGPTGPSGLINGDQTISGIKTFSSKVILQSQIETTPGTDLGTTGTLTLNMDGASILSTGELTGAVTWATSNRAAGRSVTVRVVNGATLRAFTFPAWKFVGPKPADIAASKVGILTITAFGTADTDIVAAWAVEE